MHPEAHAAMDRMLTEARIDRAAPLRVLDLGGADVNGSIRDLLPKAEWTGLDIQPGPGVDIVADATTWDPPDDREWDVVVCTELLEHVHNWTAVLAAASSALRYSGRHLFVTCASTGRPPHGARGAAEPAPGEHYANIDPDRLGEVLGVLFTRAEVTYQPIPGDAYAWAVL